MAVELKRYRFTRADYHRMAETGILAPDARVELIDGEIIEMSPVGSPHMGVVNRLNRLFTHRLGDAAVVQIQGPIALGDNGEPEPDVALLRFRDDFYSTATATEADTLLLIEVADSSERYDRQTKGPLYARYGIPELWIAELNHDRVIRHLDPTPTGYAHTRIFRRGESLSPLAFPDLSISVDDILGPRPRPRRRGASRS
ncbi:MAG: Uma2 family endonuclease [Chloroflexota bacterium]